MNIKPHMIKRNKSNNNNIGHSDYTVKENFKSWLSNG